MPCISEPYPDRTPKRSQDDKTAEAALCAILTHAEKSFTFTELLSSLNYEKAGITQKDLEKWWYNHKRKDKKKAKHK